MTAVNRLGLGALLALTVVPGARAGVIPPVPPTLGSPTPDPLSSKWAIVENAATAYANSHGGMAPPSTTMPAPTPTGTGFDPAASAPASSPAPAPAPASAAPAVTLAAPAPASSGSAFDGFINLGQGPYPEAGFLTNGGAQAWYASPRIAALFGGPPGSQQQADFVSAVFQHVERTFGLSGVPVGLTVDPTVQAAHSISVVSNTSSVSPPNALGLTAIGSNGFDFIDQAALSARTVDQLSWIVAHNVAHEMMLAFGVGENYDQTGNFIDATVAKWSMLTDPNARFSAGASQALLSADFQQNFSGTGSPLGAQLLQNAEAVPEPASLALVALGAAGLALGRRARRRASR